MRIAIAAVLGLTLAANLAGCGGATIPTPPDNAKLGPPPGYSPELAKGPKEGAASTGGGMKGAGPPVRTIPR
jgi:hypothetical protein